MHRYHSLISGILRTAAAASLLAVSASAQEVREAGPVKPGDSPTLKTPYAGLVVVNVKPDGSIIFNRKTISGPDLVLKLQELARLHPDQAVILRGDHNANFKCFVNVLDLCRQANIWNVAFATSGNSGT
jgi:biopolymer transport protein ExbD